MYNPFTNERISVNLDKHGRKFLDTKDYFVKQISHLSKGYTSLSVMSIIILGAHIARDILEI